MELLTEFAAHFHADRDSVGHAPRDPLLQEAHAYGAYADEVAGRSFNGGVYRGHDSESAQLARELVVAAFPEVEESVSLPFGYDWLGRQFALDATRRDGGQPFTVLCEPGTGQVLNIPASLGSFHEQVLVEEPEAAFEASLFGRWTRANGDSLPLARDVCVGYKVPPFLGGEHTLDNLEVSDIDVYWHLIGQLRLKIRDLPPGTAIGEVTIE